MRQSHSYVSLGDLCALFGVTRQAYYDAIRHAEKATIANMVVLTLVKEIRSQMPMLGTRKLMYVLEPKLVEHGIKMGRDQLFDLLRFHGLLIRRRKRIARTTDSNHVFRRYPNLIKELIITGPEQLWISDITYIRTLHGFSYLSLITDAYSRMIVGYSKSILCFQMFNFMKKVINKFPLSLPITEDKELPVCTFINKS